MASWTPSTSEPMEFPENLGSTALRQNWNIVVNRAPWGSTNTSLEFSQPSDFSKFYWS